MCLSNLLVHGGIISGYMNEDHNLSLHQEPIVFQAVVEPLVVECWHAHTSLAHCGQMQLFWAHDYKGGVLILR